MTTDRPTGVRWIVLVLLCLSGFVAYVLRLNMSIAGPAMKGDLGFSEMQLGMILAAFAWGYGIFQLPGGLFGEWAGARRAMATLTLAWAGITAMTGLAPGTSTVSAGMCVGMLAGLRFGIGVSQAALYPVTSGISMVDWFPVRNWGLINGLGTTALTLGAAAAGPGVAWLVGTVGWRNSFLLTAPLGVVLAAAWWWFYRDDPAEHRSVNAAELSLIRAGRPERSPRKAEDSWRLVAKHRDVLAITASYFCMNYVFYLFFNWFFYYLVEVRHLSPMVGGYFTSAQWIVGSIAACFGGWLCDHLSARLGPRNGCRFTVVGGLLLSAPLLVAGAIAEHPVTAVILLSLSFGATQLTDGAYWTAGMRIGGVHAAAATGLMNTGGNIVGGAGALMVPAIAGSFGWLAALSTGAVFAILGAGFWIWIHADVPMDKPA